MLSDLQLAAAFSEQVYRRGALDQPLYRLDDKGNQVKEGFDLNATPVTADISGFTKNDGFYYNNDTGFVGQIIRANGKLFVVFRGSDLSGSGWDVANAFLSDPPAGGVEGYVDKQDWSDNRKLGVGTIDYTQLDDALKLVEYAKSISASPVIVTGQSLGGGLEAVMNLLRARRPASA